MLGFLKGLIGTKSDKDIKAIKPYIAKIKEVYPAIQQLSNDALRAKTVEFQQRIADAVRDEQAEIDRLISQAVGLDIGVNISREKIWQNIDKIDNEIYDKIQKMLGEILPEAFSVVKETAKRFTENEWTEVKATEMDIELSHHNEDIVISNGKARYHNTWMAGGSRIHWNMIHYDVQLMGGVVLHEGKIAEMATGEGKTLVATLPVYLNALSGRGVHVVTVNDYLAKRDSEWMGMLFQFHGLRVDCIDKHHPNSVERRRAYAADITYGTNNEFGFDYLRDNMVRDSSKMAQSMLNEKSLLNYAIVDEVDSVLIDEARTPLIISGPKEEQDDKQEFDAYKPIAEKLYRIQKDLVNKCLTEAKASLKADSAGGDAKRGGEQLLRAHHGLPKYGALIKFLSEPGMRSLMQKTENFYMQNQSKEMHIINNELYFVIDEKNNSIDLTEKGINYVNDLVNDPDFYHLPDVGSEVAEIEKMEISDAEKTERKSKAIQNFSTKADRVHIVNQLLRAYAMFEEDVEYVVMNGQIKIVDEKTGRIMEGRRYSDGLHQALEAKHNITIADATQTYATISLQNNFRMYRKLAGMTGTAETEAGEFWNIYKLDVVVIPTNRPIVRADHEDMVYKTAREKYNAVIDEIESMVKAGRPVLVGTTSVENSELLSRMLTRKGLKHNVLNAKMHQREAEIVAEAGQAGTITIATSMAGRGTDIKLGAGVKDAGGLAIIGTERHDSRRVDRQLRGRAGRQGDPGSSQFFVSLEDDLMRMFGSERIAGIMDRLGLKEGEMIQHSMITKSIERAQKKVEENNFGIRKRLLDYDNVMNSQRGVIYRRRQNALFGGRFALDVKYMIDDVCSEIMQDNHKNRDYEGFKYELLSSLAIDSPFSEEKFLNGKVTNLTDQLVDAVYQAYMKKRNSIAERTHLLVKHVFENQKQYENIVIPFNDGKRQYQAPISLVKAYENNWEILMDMERNFTLERTDEAWIRHLSQMDDLRQSVQNATYEQKDPLVIYKFESFNLFTIMLMNVNKEILTFLLRCDIPDIPIGSDSMHQIGSSQGKKERKDLLSRSYSDTQAHQRNQQPVRVEKTVGRNDPCPCGSGKKFKHCHGKV